MKNNHKRPSGFTLIELLIVIVIIAILAAITLVAYNGIQQRAHATTAQTDAEQLAKLLALSNISNGSYPSDLSTINNGSPLSTSDGTSYVYHQQNSGADYCVTVTNTTTSYVITDTNTAPIAGGCPGDGQGGQGAVTNLANYGTAVSWQPSNGNFGFMNNRYGSDESYSLLTGVTTPISTLNTAARVTWTTTNWSGRGFQMGQNPDVSLTGGEPVSSGTAYEVSLYARAHFASLSTTGNLTCATYNSSGTNLGTTNATGPTLTTNWQRYSLGLTTPSTATALGCRFALSSGSPAIGDTLDGTGLMLTQGSTLYNYADGNSPSWIWNGTANGSTSTGPAS